MQWSENQGRNWWGPEHCSFVVKEESCPPSGKNGNWYSHSNCALKILTRPLTTSSEDRDCGSVVAMWFVTAWTLRMRVCSLGRCRARAAERGMLRSTSFQPLVCQDDCDIRFQHLSMTRSKSGSDLQIRRGRRIRSVWPTGTRARRWWVEPTRSVIGDSVATHCWWRTDPGTGQSVLDTGRSLMCFGSRGWTNEKKRGWCVRCWCVVQRLCFLHLFESGGQWKRELLWKKEKKNDGKLELALSSSDCHPRLGIWNYVGFKNRRFLLMLEYDAEVHRVVLELYVVVGTCRKDYFQINCKHFTSEYKKWLRKFYMKNHGYGKWLWEQVCDELQHHHKQQLERRVQHAAHQERHQWRRWHIALAL